MEPTGLQWDWVSQPSMSSCSSSAAPPMAERRLGIVRKLPRKEKANGVAGKLGVVSGMALVSCHEVPLAASASSAFGTLLLTTMVTSIRDVRCGYYRCGRDDV